MRATADRDWDPALLRLIRVNIKDHFGEKIIKIRPSVGELLGFWSFSHGFRGLGFFPSRAFSFDRVGLCGSGFRFLMAFSVFRLPLRFFSFRWDLIFFFFFSLVLSTLGFDPSHPPDLSLPFLICAGIFRNFFLFFFIF